MRRLKISMDKNNFNDDELYKGNTSDDDDLYAEKISLDKEPQPKQHDIATNLEDDDIHTEKVHIDKQTRPKTFHSKNFIDSDTQAAEDKKKSSSRESELKTKLSHAETSGIAISAVMFAYSLAEADKPLFFLSTALLTFLLRPLIGALFGKNNRAVQNALHSFSIVLFIGAMLFLFL